MRCSIRFCSHLIISDTTQGATGRLTGVSDGGRMFSPVTLVWLPLELGPATNNALSGSLGTTVFQISNQTRLVAPNSGGKYRVKRGPGRDLCCNSLADRKENSRAGNPVRCLR